MSGFYRDTVVSQHIEQRLDIVRGRFDDQQLQGFDGFHNGVVYLPDGCSEYRMGAYGVLPGSGQTGILHRPFKVALRTSVAPSGSTSLPIETRESTGNTTGD